MSKLSSNIFKCLGAFTTGVLITTNLIEIGYFIKENPKYIIIDRKSVV